jgi:uncharacterized cofD-like protein
MIDIVTIGGGSGHTHVLRGLRTIADVRITAICPSTDSGGSTGQFAREYDSRGYLGDLTKCVAALCPDEVLRRALLYRFDEGVLEGHSVKNMLLLGLEKACGRAHGLRQLYRIAGITPHRVIPVAVRAAELCARLRLGAEIHGETNIDFLAKNPLWHPDAHAIEQVFLKPAVRASKVAVTAVRRAQWIVICPGDLYSSILPVLLPVGMQEAIQNTSARIAIILNIMTKQGETDGYRAEDFLAHIERHLGRSCDVVLANTAPIPRRFRLLYAVERKVQLPSGASVKQGFGQNRRVIARPFMKATPKGAIFHDEKAIAQALLEVFQQKSAL